MYIQEWLDALQAISPMTFPQQREGQRALQAVEITAQRRSGDPQLAGTTDTAGSHLRKYTFTFCLERVSKGPFKVTALCNTELHVAC